MMHKSIIVHQNIDIYNFINFQVVLFSNLISLILFGSRRKLHFK